MMDTKKIPLKQIAFAFLILTIGGIVVYTSWKMGQEPEEDGSPSAYSMTETTPEQDAEPAAEKPARPVSAYPKGQADEENASCYRLYVENGTLLVYDPKQDRSFPAGLDYELLPESLQQEMEQGKYFDTQEELLEFLENYSS
jgi:hypothetical protein